LQRFEFPGPDRQELMWRWTEKVVPRRYRGRVVEVLVRRRSRSASRASYQTVVGDDASDTVMGHGFLA
jgi:hypothetical protein